MAVAIAGSVVVGESASSALLTIAVTVSAGSDRCQNVNVTSFDAYPTAVIWNTTETHTLIVQNNQAGERASMYRRIAPTETTANVTVAFALAEEVVAAVLNLTGVHQTTPVGDSDSSGGDSTSDGTATAALTSETDGLAIDVLSMFGTEADLAIGAGQTSRWSEDNGGALESSYGSSEPGAASVTMSWTWTDRTFAHCAAAFSPAAAADTMISPTYPVFSQSVRMIPSGGSRF